MLWLATPEDCQDTNKFSANRKKRFCSHSSSAAKRKRFYFQPIGRRGFVLISSSSANRKRFYFQRKWKMGKTHYTAVLYYYLSQLRWSRHWEGGCVKLLALSLSSFFDYWNRRERTRTQYCSRRRVGEVYPAVWSTFHAPRIIDFIGYGWVMSSKRSCLDTT